MLSLLNLCNFHVKKREKYPVMVVEYLESITYSPYYRNLPKAFISSTKI